MGSPARTSAVQGVPSGSWMRQCLAALSLSGASVLQASDWGRDGEGHGELAGTPRRAMGAGLRSPRS